MMDSGTLRDGKEEPQALQVATYLWEEYRYRHDLVWQLVFRVTAVATALLIAPFLTNESVRKVVGGWLLFLPGLAIAVIAIGYYVLQPELHLLRRIRTAYREAQNRALHHLQPQWDPHEIRFVGQDGAELGPRQIPRILRFHFEERVSLFLALLLVAAVAFFVLFRVAWLPQLR
jgi:hypothetical protein